MMDTENKDSYNQGVVIRKQIGNCTVRTNSSLIPCAISNKLRKEMVYSTADPGGNHRKVNSVRILDQEDPLAVGDIVRYIDAGNGTGMVVEILPRRNRFSRRAASPGAHRHNFEHVIVANLDQVVAVFAAARPTPNWNMLDRYLAAAGSLDLSLLIVITKMDLITENDKMLHAVLEEYRRIGYPVILTSAYSGLGLDELRIALGGRLSVLAGKSGVGKTALLNALEPGLGRRVGEVGSGVIGKGKHTTTHAEMIPLGIGGDLVDTPGVREFGLWDVKRNELALYFPEMKPMVGTCKFGMNCAHSQEPGCAIRQAVMEGTISTRRYQNYLQLKEEL